MNNFQQFLWWLLFYLGIALAFAYVLLFGDAPQYDGRCIGRANRFFTVKIPQIWSGSVLPALVCGQDRAKRFNSCLGVACEKYIMPVFYHLLLIGGMYIGQMKLISRVTELDFYDAAKSPCPLSRFFCFKTGRMTIALPPRPSEYIIPVYYVICVLSWLMVYGTDPGKITKLTSSSAESSLSSSSSSSPSHDKPNKYQHLFPYDHLLFKAGNRCWTCKTIKPARSKHCSVCDHCVVRFDHHCGWMGCCIGLLNVRYFLFFLLLHTVILFHGCIASFELVLASVNRLIYGKYSFRSTGALITRFSFNVAFVAEPALCAISICFGLSTLLVGAFFAYHCRLIWRNTTSNESSKWDTIRDVETQYLKKHGRNLWDDIREERAQQKESSASQANHPERQRNHHVSQEIEEGHCLSEEGNVNATSQSEDADIGEDELEFGDQSLSEIAFDAKGSPVNIYDRGPMANFTEVLVPHRLFKKRSVSDHTTRKLE